MEDLYKRTNQNRLNLFVLRKRRLLLFLLLLAGSVAARAQQSKRVEGTVTDGQNVSIPGVSVLVEKSTRGVTTDLDGSYSIDVKPTDRLTFSYLGFESQTVEVGAKTRINIVLKEKGNLLDEVTVVAYGHQKKASVIGAVTTVNTGDLNVPFGHLSHSFAGQIPGVIAIQRSGEPGSSAEFWIRGLATFNSNAPLVLVDGIERLPDLVDVEDIASLTVLKDATATALYGVRGANGVMLITTKKGKEGKTQISFKAEYGLMAPTYVPEMANAEEWINAYNLVFAENNNGRVAYTQEDIQKYVSGNDPDLYPNINWMKEIYKDFTDSHRFAANVSGGNKTVRFYASGSYYNEDGIYNVARNRDYDATLNYSRYSFRSNVDINLHRDLVLNLNIADSYEVKNNPYANGLSIWIQTYMAVPISTPKIFSNGMLAQPKNGHNPYYLLNSTGYTQYFKNTAQSLAGLTYDFSNTLLKGLSGNIKFSWDVINESSTTRQKRPNTYYVMDPANGRDEEGNLLLTQNVQGFNYMVSSNWGAGTRIMYLESSLTYDRLFSDKHRVGGLLMYNMRDLSNNMPGSYLQSLPYRYLGVAGRVTYSFKDTYFIESNFGYNGSENFAPGKRFGFFPSLALGYIVSNEPYFHHLLPVINSLKIRGSNGKAGNDQIGGGRRFAYNPEMLVGSNSYSWGSTGQTYRSGISTGYPGSPGVSWEVANKSDIGIEMGLFRKLTLQMDYFYEHRTGIFIEQQSYASIVGKPLRPYVNLGEMKNQGMDASLVFETNIDQVKIRTRGNFTYARNQNLYDDAPAPRMPYLDKVGKPWYQQFGLVAIGLFESEEDIANSPEQKFGKVRVGDIKFKDVNGDGVIDSDDRIAMGYTHVPEINYGFGISGEWKSFRLSAFMQGVAHVTNWVDGVPLNGFEQSNIPNMGLYRDVALNSWTPDNPNPNAKYPRLAMPTSENNKQLSSWRQDTRAFMRLSEIQLNYDFPKKLVNKAGMEAAYIRLSGVNLFTFSKFKLWDPAFTNSQGDSYPNNKSITATLGLNF
ncbi:MAG: TonB-dependent receptor [Dysgonamonadaceae bacterium]|jgi:TonB-linked SusC/RagA family outer membrane protein|nr:TonB-dependent receptor [Dysgonamonadaceae bacterium]